MQSSKLHASPSKVCISLCFSKTCRHFPPILLLGCFFLLPLLIFIGLDDFGIEFRRVLKIEEDAMDVLMTLERAKRKVGIDIRLVDCNPLVFGPLPLNNDGWLMCVQFRS